MESQEFGSLHIRCTRVITNSKLSGVIRSVSANLCFAQRYEEALTYLLGAYDASPCSSPLHREIFRVREEIKSLVRKK